MRLNWANIVIGAIANNRLAKAFRLLFGVILVFIYIKELGYTFSNNTLQRYDYIYIRQRFLTFN